MYGRVPFPAVAPRGSVLTRGRAQDLYGDAFNESVLMRPGPVADPALGFLRQPGHRRAVNTIAATIGGTSGRLRKIQTGYARSYALSMLIGAVLLVAGLLVVRL